MSAHTPLILRPSTRVVPQAACRCRHQPPQQQPRTLRRLISSSQATAQSPPSVSDWPRCANPSPYEVLNHPRCAPYSKTQFRHLVKLYHPDLHSPPSPPGIAPSTRLERYHLVVRAHDILSDPAKRWAYDASGAHWEGTRPPLTDSERYEAWRKGPYASCANNGNWEDWERWYEEQATGGNGGARRNEPYYMSNGTFLGLVVTTISILSIMQAARAETQRFAMTEQAYKQRKELSESLRRSHAEVDGMGQEQRIERFLRHRENTAFGFHPARHENTHRDTHPGSYDNNNNNSNINSITHNKP